MGIREKLERNRAVIGGSAIALLLVAALSIYRQTLWEPRRDVRLMNSAFFSDDDGKTWFVDNIGQTPPFQHNGKPACRARVYRYGQGKKYVAYLERFSDAQKQELRAQKAAPAGQRDVRPLAKRPGDTEWVADGLTPAQSAAFLKVTTPRNPDGSTNVSEVTPSDSDALQ